MAGTTQSNYLRFKVGTPLAEQQDEIFRRYRSGEISTGEAYNLSCELSKNLWVPLASRLAPGNLVIRQYCLMDLLEENCCHWKQISRLLRLLAPANPMGMLWLEGYSYWLYTKPFLEEYAKKAPDRSVTLALRGVIKNVDSGFIKTAYYRNGVLYPAPFGDLRDIPLEIRGTQFPELSGTSAIPPVYKNGNKYVFKKCLLGFNMHAQSDTRTVVVLGGEPINFTWYEGYDKKYRSTLAELKDMLRLDRVASAVKLFFRN